MLMYLMEVWLLAFSTAAQFNIEAVLLREGRPAGEAVKLRVGLNAKAPVTIAYLQVILTALHGAIGVAGTQRKRNMGKEAQWRPASDTASRRS